MPSGIIMKGIGGFYYVLCEEAVYECKARGIFRKDDIAPLPGDKVEISIIDYEKKLGSIVKIYPRLSRLVRPAVANVDQVVVIIAVKSPEPDFLLLDKLLVTSEKDNINAIICINKIDLDISHEHERIVENYSKAGYKLILTSLKTNEGFDDFRQALKGRISVFAGQSGVGKSTILNTIMDTFVMKTGTLSEKIGRGKHTTRHAELIPLIDGGYIVDTPGFSTFELLDIDYKDLQNYYHEFSDFKDNCRFTGCSHVNEPDCRVKNEVNSGSISKERYERYVELFFYLKRIDEMKYKKTNKER